MDAAQYAAGDVGAFGGGVGGEVGQGAVVGLVPDGLGGVAVGVARVA
ncbi:hypothetical protein FHS29_001575 [Saccharothrix tamanrassetensis]|uniref:Uncharacterized protein n=1 Tax=Saccharothrix tamanrassetensis TaxID=1051531 RepID=A0A841CG58_9PSEU|nr:hypothetical protein [Saccharothrix tamanrassetensis]